VPARADGFRGTPTWTVPATWRNYRSDQYGGDRVAAGPRAADSTLLEAPGGSYSDYDWVSAQTASPLCWGGGHELQWRGNYDEGRPREPDIAAIYQGTEPLAPWHC
jgi:uncharacterized membrane protein